MLTENPKKLLSARELAELIQVHPGTVRNWVYQGRVPHRKIGKAVRFTAEDVQAIIGQPVAAGGRS